MASEMRRYSDLSGRVAVVTGGAQGLGLTAAEALLGAGMAVSIWDVNEQALSAAAVELSKQGRKVDCRTVDTTKLAMVEATFRQVEEALGAIDVFINNAALKENFMGRPEGEHGGWSTSFWEQDAERVRRLVEVNTLGTYHGSRVAAAAMAARGRGSIMNVSTSKDTQVAGNHFPYGPTKAFIDAFSMAGAEQLKPFGVRLNAILPGGRVNPRHGVRPGGRPYDLMVPLTLYLASDASAHVTGQVLIAEAFNKEAR